jgi:hypothetical protein
VSISCKRTIRDSWADLSGAREAVVGRVGSCFNLDSDEEVTAVLKMDPILAKIIGFRKVNARLLEELAIAHDIPRLLVRYNRCQKRLRSLEAVIQSVHNGRAEYNFGR